MFKDKVTVKEIARKRIRQRIKKKIHGTSERPRVYIRKSNRYIYAQVIDDDNHNVLVSASTLEKELQTKGKSTKNVDASSALGKVLAKRLKEKRSHCACSILAGTSSLFIYTFLRRIIQTWA